MNYLLNNNAKFRNSRGLLLVWLFGFLVLIFCIWVLFNGKEFSSILTSVSRPVWVARETIIDSIPKTVLGVASSKEDLIEQNSTLRALIQQSGLLQVENKYLREENETLRAQLSIKNSTNGILATVLVRPPRSAYDTLIVDAGLDRGLSIGDRVVYGMFAVGEVTDVYPNLSKVTLYSSSGLETDVLIGSSTISARARGLGGYNFSIKLPVGVSVLEGDIVSLPTTHHPILGVVSRVQESKSDSLQTILFHTPKNIEELKWIEIIPQNHSRVQ